MYVHVADNPPCITIVLGGGQMGCKTEGEWEKIGMIQCGVRVTSNVAYHHTIKVCDVATTDHMVCICIHTYICVYTYQIL